MDLSFPPSFCSLSFDVGSVELPMVIKLVLPSFMGPDILLAIFNPVILLGPTGGVTRVV